ncbi:MmpS family protein [Herbiconiux sp. CPCC 205716]|uniref:MmpS family protein n=1 Tax=Herbiconiux gentiana TaxID=2970912 RepID=A0ABT2GF10_9MICO|nr:MmpS family protein [Herbiconiux gentiana]MCS5713479.1 MmpS family protein [Herbiconiux gentiana]
MSHPPQPPYPPTPAGALLPNKLGLAALWVGIGAFVAGLIPFFSYFAILVALVGVVLGVVALVLPRRRKKAATAGTIVSFMALIVSLGMSILYTVWLFGSLIGAVSGSLTPSTSSPLDQTSVSLSYEVEGTGSDVDITYTTFVDGVDATQQETGQRLPFARDFDVAYGGAATYNSYTLTAVNGDSDGDVTCRITLDDRILIERTATGPFATATCTASGTDLLEG